METIAPAIKAELKRLSELPSDSAVATSSPLAIQQAVNRNPVTVVIVDWLREAGHVAAAAELEEMMMPRLSFVNQLAPSEKD